MFNFILIVCSYKILLVLWALINIIDCARIRIKRANKIQGPQKKCNRNKTEKIRGGETNTYTPLAFTF